MNAIIRFLLWLADACLALAVKLRAAQVEAEPLEIAVREPSSTVEFVDVTKN